MAHGFAGGGGDAFGGSGGDGLVGRFGGIGPALLHEGDASPEAVDHGETDEATVAALGVGGLEIDERGVEVGVDALIDGFDAGEGETLLLGLGLVVFGDHGHAVGSFGRA